jgi:hypothetical protein
LRVPAVQVIGGGVLCKKSTQFSRRSDRRAHRLYGSSTQRQRNRTRARSAPVTAESHTAHASSGAQWASDRNQLSNGSPLPRRPTSPAGSWPRTGTCRRRRRQASRGTSLAKERNRTHAKNNKKAGQSRASWTCSERAKAASQAEQCAGITAIISHLQPSARARSAGSRKQLRMRQHTKQTVQQPKRDGTEEQCGTNGARGVMQRCAGAQHIRHVEKSRGMRANASPR